MNIRVDLNYPIKDGTEVKFRSPVDCSQVTGLKVYYNGGSQEFAFADAHGNNVGDIDHLFAENVVVKVILDVTTSMAFVQNADTNAYLEGRFAECVTHTKQAITEEQKTQARLNIGAGSAIINAAEGKHITLTDSANSPVQDLKAYIPENTKGVNALKLSARGKNIANTDFSVGLLYSGTVYTNASSKVTLPYKSANEGTGLAVILPCKAGVTYKLSANMDLPNCKASASVYSSVEEAKSYKNALASYEDYNGSIKKGFTCKCGYDGIIVVGYRWKWSDGTTNAGTFPEGFVPYIAVESTLSEFEEPCGNTYAVTLPETSYGGYVDFVAGKYVKTHTLDEETGEAIELETPVEHNVGNLPQVSTLYPITSIFTDSGDVSVSYVADTKNYIDKKFNELATAMIANG